MENIYYLLFISLLLWYFIYLRKLAEVAKQQAQYYCKKENLQFMAIARRSSRLRFSKQDGIHWLSVFDFEFSSDGEASYKGELILRGLKLGDLTIPPYRI